MSFSSREINLSSTRLSHKKWGCKQRSLEHATRHHCTWFRLRESSNIRLSRSRIWHMGQCRWIIKWDLRPCSITKWVNHSPEQNLPPIQKQRANQWTDGLFSPRKSIQTSKRSSWMTCHHRVYLGNRDIMEITGKDLRSLLKSSQLNR